MNVAKYLLLYIIIIYFSACSSKESNFGIEKDVIISGRIIDFNKEINPNTVQIIRNDLLDLNEKHNAVIDEKGFFKIVFPIAYSQELYLLYGNILPLALKPGDSLYVEIDNQFSTYEAIPLADSIFSILFKFVHFSDNEVGMTNYAINEYFGQLPFEEYFWTTAKEAEKNLNAKEYTEFVQERDKALNENYNYYISENKTTPLFKAYCRDFIKYGELNSLMRYRWTHPDHNSIDLDNFTLPEDYFSFLAEYDMNDTKFFSFAHSDFLHEFFGYASQTPKDTFLKAKNLPREKAYAIITEMIKINTSGFTRELFLSKNYMLLIKALLIDIFESIYDSNALSHPYFRNTIDNEYNKLKKYMSNLNTEGANLLSLKSSITSALMDSISAKYKGKVIYIDFWAPWCGPCMQEMPFSKDIQDYFKNENVAFVFLASRCKENSWKSTIANNKLSGEHILLTDDQFNVLSANLHITGIPHYTLVDKNGNIVLKHAPRPSEKDRLIEEIERQIEKP